MSYIDIIARLRAAGDAEAADAIETLVLERAIYDAIVLPVPMQEVLVERDKLRNLVGRAGHLMKHSAPHETCPVCQWLAELDRIPRAQ